MKALRIENIIHVPATGSQTRDHWEIEGVDAVFGHEEFAKMYCVLVTTLNIKFKELGLHEDFTLSIDYGYSNIRVFITPKPEKEDSTFDSRYYSVCEFNSQIRNYMISEDDTDTVYEMPKLKMSSSNRTSKESALLIGRALVGAHDLMMMMEDVLIDSEDRARASIINQHLEAKKNRDLLVEKRNAFRDEEIIVTSNGKVKIKDTWKNIILTSAVYVDRNWIQSSDVTNVIRTFNLEGTINSKQATTYLNSLSKTDEMITKLENGSYHVSQAASGDMRDMLEAVDLV